MTRTSPLTDLMLAAFHFAADNIKNRDRLELAVKRYKAEEPRQKLQYEPELLAACEEALGPTMKDLMFGLARIRGALTLLGHKLPPGHERVDLYG